MEEEIIDTSGFYRLEGETLLHAPNFVYSKGYELLREKKDQYIYPIDGWHWFDSKIEAYEFFEIEIPAPGDSDF